jgi:hypothetical protein
MADKEAEKHYDLLSKVNAVLLALEEAVDFPCQKHDNYQDGCPICHAQRACADLRVIREVLITYPPTPEEQKQSVAEITRELREQPRRDPMLREGLEDDDLAEVLKVPDTSRPVTVELEEATEIRTVSKNKGVSKGTIVARRSSKKGQTRGKK